MLSYASLVMKVNLISYLRVVPSRIEAEDRYQHFIIHTISGMLKKKKDRMRSKKDSQSTCIHKYRPCYFWQALSYLGFVIPLLCRFYYCLHLSVPILYYSCDCEISFLHIVIQFKYNTSHLIHLSMLQVVFSSLKEAFCL